MSFKEFVEKWNQELEGTKSTYCRFANELTCWDEPYSIEDEPYEDFLCRLLYDEEYPIYVQKTIDHDIDNGIVEYELIFEVEGTKYFITIAETDNCLQTSKIFPVTSEKEIKATEYRISADSDVIVLEGK